MHAARLILLESSNRERNLVRQMRLMGTPVFLARHWNQEQLLRKISLDSYVGMGTYGIPNAAHRLFGVDWWQLLPHQVATIVAAIAAPSSSSPWCNPDRALLRRNRLLDAMRESGMLDEQTWKDSVAQPLGIVCEPGQLCCTYQSRREDENDEDLHCELAPGCLMPHSST